MVSMTAACRVAMGVTQHMILVMTHSWCTAEISNMHERKHKCAQMWSRYYEAKREVTKLIQSLKQIRASIQKVLCDLQ